ncbi:MAG: cytochrome c [Thioalkalispiraceae bacterium]|jgi:mono/diheme cytochrome c family protein
MKHTLLLFVMALLLSACTEDETVQAGREADTPRPIRKMDFAQISRGGTLFQQHCAVCHGRQAEGAPDWQQMDANGKFPPPPLNGSAHAWHHPQQVLVDTIKNGTVKQGGNMPAWKDKLSDEQINAIIAWFQSKWSDEIYSAWYVRDQHSR